MKRLAWLTELHLNFVTDECRTATLVQEIEAAGADAVLVGGDIAEADSFAEYLEVLSIRVALPIYFVLGNHDYYRSSIGAVRHASQILSQQSDMLHWLPASGVVQLTEETALVGHGGWGDGRAGDFQKSEVVLNDYLLIDELRDTHDFPKSDKILTQRLLDKLRALGDEAEAHFRTVLPQALQTSRHVVVLTHVPPFREACWHQEYLSDDNWAPHFVCQAVGDLLKDSMLKNPEKHMSVLCGHTRSSGQAQILRNLQVQSGKASYGEPEMQRIIEVT